MTLGNNCKFTDEVIERKRCRVACPDPASGGRAACLGRSPYFSSRLRGAAPRTERRLPSTHSVPGTAGPVVSALDLQTRAVHVVGRSSGWLDSKWGLWSRRPPCIK